MCPSCCGLTGQFCAKYTSLILSCEPKSMCRADSSNAAMCISEQNAVVTVAANIARADSTAAWSDRAVTDSQDCPRDFRSNGTTSTNCKLHRDMGAVLVHLQVLVACKMHCIECKVLSLFHCPRIERLIATLSKFQVVRAQRLTVDGRRAVLNNLFAQKI